MIFIIAAPVNSEYLPQFLFSLENEFRSILLKILLLDVTIPQLKFYNPNNNNSHNNHTAEMTWALQVTTKDFNSNEIGKFVDRNVSF